MPRNVNQDQVRVLRANTRQMIALAQGRGYCELEENYLNDRPKSLTAYYGPDLVNLS